MAAVLALLSALLWGTADFAGGLASRRLPALVVVGWSQIAALAALLAVVGASRTWADPDTWLLWGLAAGVSGAGGLVCFYRALAIGTMGVVSPIGALGALVPVLVGLASGDRPSQVQVVGMVLALLGAVAASGPELSGSARGASVALAALAGLLFGLALVLIARGAQGSPLLTATAMRFSSLVLFGTVALLARTAGGVARRDVPMLVAIGVADGAANVLFGFASTLGLVSVVAVLGSLYPVGTVLLARGILGERLLPVQVAGVAVAFAGVALLSAG